MTPNLAARRIAPAVVLAVVTVACSVPPPEQAETGCVADAQASPVCPGYVAPVVDAASADADGGPSEGGAEFFGKACSANPDCGGKAPVCAGVLGYCTQTDCNAGEAHAGVCPAGWTCVSASPGTQSGCFNPNG